MLSGFFNYDNPVWRFIGKFGDLILLNILWVICSIPIFTIGASTTAVYYVTLKLARDDDGYTIKSFFKSFKENFKQATVIWLLLLVAGAILGVDLYFFARIYVGNGTVKTVMLTVFLALLIVYTAIFMYIFPLQSRFYNGVKRTIFNAFFMSIRHLFRTIGMIAINGALLAAGFYFMIPPILMIFMLFGFPLLAFINSYILAPVFELYMPKTKQTDDELRPLFGDGEEPISSILMAKGDENSLADKNSSIEEDGDEDMPEKQN
ncbi:YesL family protein [Clostridium sp. HBUAS56010]|uniref:YesL family protein n=1 Tax=Clostridium sp. HBUAS56010 TaxID=2571127 RepID=UPI001177EB02|nr:YesL family protein [Clostridium sp. HBUAS56010]